MNLHEDLAIAKLHKSKDANGSVLWMVWISPAEFVSCPLLSKYLSIPMGSQSKTNAFEDFPQPKSRQNHIETISFGKAAPAQLLPQKSLATCVSSTNFWKVS